MSIRVAMIGAGSLGFTRRLAQDLLTVPEFCDITLALTDISKPNLENVARLVKQDIRANHLPAKVVISTDRKKALEGADYVFSMCRVGGLEAFQSDIEIPLKYGVDQCVGDTLCAGGIFYGQRNIPVILDFCKDIRAVASKDVLFMNYANPMVMNTWAALKYGGVDTVGLCHGVHGGHWQITEVISHLINKGKKPDSKGFIPVTMPEVDVTCAGINHQTWFLRVLYKGEDWTGKLLEGFESHPTFSKTEKIRIDMIRRFGYYSTESNGHLSEYLPWYRKRPKDLKNWIDLSAWINGETAGYLRICREARIWFDKEAQKQIDEEPVIFSPEKRSAEHGSWIVEALETGRTYRGHFNVLNQGTITNLPDDAIIETPGYVDRNGVSIPKVGELPLGCAAVCNASISVQRLAVEAAVHGDVNLLKQSLLMDPLTGAVCTPPEIDQMADEMLVAQAKWLPQFAQAIPAAKKRLAGAPKLGREGFQGGARLRVRTAEELQKAAEAEKKKGAKG